MRSLRDRGLSALLSAALAASLMPAPALAEALDEAGLQAAVPATEEAMAEAAVEEPPAEEAAEPAVAEAPATELELDKDAEVELAEGEEWVAAFEAPEDGVYLFASEKGSKARAELFSDEALEKALTEEDGLVAEPAAAEATDGADVAAEVAAGEEADEEDDFALAARLAKGQKVFIKVTQRDGGELACVVKVVRVEDKAAADVAEDDEAEPTSDEAAAETVPGDAAEQADPAAATTADEAAAGTEVKPAGKIDLATVSFMVRTSTYEVTGEPVAPEVTARAEGGAELAEGADYEVAGYATKDGAALEGAPSEPGDYVVTYRGIGAYAGEATVSFSIKAAEAESEAAQEDGLLTAAVSRNIADSSCSIYNSDFFDSSTGLSSFWYTGSAIKPKVSVWIQGLTVVEGTDYTLSYANNVNAGTATVTVTGKGAFTGSKMLQFGIVKTCDISRATMTIVGYAFNQSVYEFFYTGSAIKPKVDAWLGGSTLVEGTDYTLSYANNTNKGTATITVKGKGRFTGTKTLEFSIIAPMTLSVYLSKTSADIVYGATTTAGYNGTYSDPPTFTYTGKPITPKVQFGDGGIVEGTDFNVSYVTASDKAVASPTAAGSYKIVLKAKSGSKKVTGTGEIPFEIVAKRSLASVYLEKAGAIHYGYEDGTSVAYVEDASIGLDDLTWSVTGAPGYRILAEGVDYTKSYEKRVTNGVTYYDYTFKGIGNYEGSLRYAISFSNSLQSRFDAFGYRINSTNTVYAKDDGTLQKPTISMSGLSENVDFAFDSFVDDNGNTITNVGSAGYVYVKIKGLGAYAGCTTKHSATVSYMQPLTLKGDTIAPVITNAWEPNPYYGSFYLLKSKKNAPNVALKVYGKDVLLHEGQGFKTSTKVASDQKTVDITITGTDASVVNGTKTVTVDLVDKYDVSKARSYSVKAGSYVTSIYNSAYESEGISIVVLPYAGFSYVPEGSVAAGNLTPSISTALYDASGTKVSAITKAGSYKLRVAGSGSEWGGSVDIPLDVRAQNALLLSECDIAVDEAALKNGEAEPAVTVKFGSKTFKQDTDYTVSYSNNTKPGATGWAKVTAKPGSVLAGSASKSFVVSGRTGGSLTWGFDLMLRDSVTNEYYNASLVSGNGPNIPRRAYVPTSRPAVRLVRQGDGSVVDPSNYTVTYRDNAKPGLASVTVTGKGAYKGTLSGNFLVVKAETSSFPDVKPTAWYAKVVARAASLGLVGGYADGRFGPNDPITRGQVAVILWRMAGQPAAGSAAKSFSDVKAGAYYYAAVRWASSAGVVSGYAGGTFGPNDRVTREQLAVMLANYARRVGGLSASGSAADYAGMSDASTVSSFARPAVGWCFRNKILTGSDGKVKPKGDATRAEAAKMLVGLYDLV